MPNPHPHPQTPRSQPRRNIICPHLDILNPRFIQLQRRPSLLLHARLIRTILPKDPCCKSLQLLIRQIHPQTLPHSLRKREVSPEQLGILQVSLGFESVGIFIPCWMAIQQRRRHADRSPGGDKELLPVGICEDQRFIWRYAVLAMCAGGI